VGIIRQPDFRVPIDKVVPGMVLARNLEFKGQLLLRYGISLDQEKIERLRDLGVSNVHVHFENADLEMYKDLLITQDSPPTYERLVEMVHTTFLEFIPPFARTEHSARTPELALIVDEVIDHTFDVILSSRRLTEILKATRFFQVQALRHCPAAWVFSLLIGAGLGYNLPTLLDLSLAALFYDVGMMRLPPRILAKPGRLTELEFAEIKKHVFFSRRIVEELSDFSAGAAVVAFQHHEHYYGGGYPKNRRGDDIHEFAQIVGLTDKYAAMLTEKFYRARFQPYQAYEMLLAQTKSSVSPRIFVGFLKSVLLYPRGSMLRLTTGEIAEPIDFPLHLPTRPRVLVTHAPGGEEVVGQRKTYDLVDHPAIAIESVAILDAREREPLPD
jgi:HD-GYP domain-containing protein (c-di-GMP phosphodiesterase class II)